LRTTIDSDRVEVIEADAMRIDWSAVVSPDDRVVLVANLPYNIATPLIADLLDQVPGMDRMIVMVQREVAKRLVARVGDDEYGIPSVKVAFRAPPQCRVGDRSHHPAGGTGFGPRRGAGLRAGAGRFRATAQDAAPIVVRSRDRR
jgi:16S rRNA A1518/A1519 N6-dimethyltransferase RsmA/KsgA/DIM1 with predicted DNA glycosylase/AP lyase activity